MELRAGKEGAVGFAWDFVVISKDYLCDLILGGRGGISVLQFWIELSDTKSRLDLVRDIFRGGQNLWQPSTSM